MIIGILLKATRNVTAHIRNHKPVRSYVQRGKVAVGRFTKRVHGLLAKHYPDIQKWAVQSAGHQIGLGVHIQSFDDAVLAGKEAALEALRRYNTGMGVPIPQYLRPQIKWGILKHIQWERSHGQTGIRTLYDLMSAAATDEQKAAILERFPEVLDVKEATEQAAPDIEAVLQGAQALLKRDALLDQIEQEFHVDLRGAAEKLRQQEKGKGTWKTHDLSKRRIKVYEKIKLEGLSFREVAAAVGVDVKEAYKDFQTVSAVVDKVRSRENIVRTDADAPKRATPSVVVRERSEPDPRTAHGPVKEWKHMSRVERQAIRKRYATPAKIKKSLSKPDRLKARFALNLERLERAKRRDYPEAFKDFTRDVLAGILAEME